MVANQEQGDNEKYVKRGQALIIPQRHEEVMVGGRAVPVRRITVCGLGGGKIDDGAAVQAPAGNAD